MSTTNVPYVIKTYTLSTTGTKLRCFTDSRSVLTDSQITYDDGTEDLTINQQFNSVSITNLGAVSVYASIALDPQDTNTFTSVTAPGSDGTFIITAGNSVNIKVVTISRLRLVAASSTPTVQVLLSL